MKKLLFALAIVSLSLTSCSKKLGQFVAENFSVTPNPLEAVGEKVPATVTGNIPAKFFVKNAQVTITPVLVYGDKEATSESFTFQGEKVNGNNQVISFDNGGTITIPVMYAYEPDMIKSDLVLAFQVQQGSKTYALQRVKVADGVIATSTLADAATVVPATAADNFIRVINEKVSADIKFLINKTDVRKSELGSAELAKLHQTLKDAQGNAKLEVEELNISSYASPDGKLDFNTKVAQGREKNTQAYLDAELKKNGISDFGKLTADFTPEDWDGFQKLVAASNIQDKELILSVLSMYTDPEQREKEIRNLSSVFEQLADEILPQLRYSRLTASVNVIGKSDEELKAAAANDVKSLTADEMLYTANNLLTDCKAKAAVYKACTEKYPNDARGFNNLGTCQYKAGDFAAAAANFNKAASLDPAMKEAKMNQGLVALVNKNYAEAKQKLGAAAGAAGLNAALGTLYLQTGDFATAANAFGATKSNNAALAKLLTKDYSGAQAAIAGIANPDATTYYIAAVLAARTNNEAGVASNLRQAVKLDSTLAEKAKKDLEFAKFDLSGAL